MNFEGVTKNAKAAQITKSVIAQGIKIFNKRDFFSSLILTPKNCVKSKTRQKFATGDLQFVPNATRRSERKNRKKILKPARDFRFQNIPNNI